MTNGCRQHQQMPSRMLIGIFVQEKKKPPYEIEPPAYANEDQYVRRQMIEEPAPPCYHDPSHRQVDDRGNNLEFPGKTDFKKNFYGFLYTSFLNQGNVETFISIEL